MPDIVADLMAGLDSYDSVIPMSGTAQRFGVKQTSVEQFVLGMLAQQRRAR